MKDPYKILNVSPQATDEEIKKAYRDLARKYHPDNYMNSPLKDVAEEKMKEVNEAYNQILSMRKGTSSGTYTGYGYQQNRSYGGGIYAQIRSCLAMGNIVQAEQMLEGIQDRNAEWHFLMGSLLYRKGWMDEARQHFTMAYEMNPQNLEYYQAYQRMNQSNMGMFGMQQNDAYGMCLRIACCSSLISPCC